MKNTTKNEVKEKIKRLSKALADFHNSLDDLYDLIENHNATFNYLEAFIAYIPLNSYNVVLKQQATITEIIEELKK